MNRLTPVQIFIKKLMVFGAFLSPALLFQNCGLNQNPKVLTESSLSTASFRFEAAKQVLDRNCNSCHGAGSATSFELSSEGDFITRGLVVPGDITRSKLIYRLRNYTGTANGAQNMPPNGSMSASDYSTLVRWVERIGVAETIACGTNEHILKPQIKRLTQAQFRNSINASFGAIFQDADFPAFRDSNPRIGLGADPDVLSINEVNIGNYYDSSVLISARARNSVAEIISCVSSTGETCFSNLINTYGLRLWRRPLVAEEINGLTADLAQLSTAGATRAQRADWLLQTLILSPNHLFRTELGSGTSPAQGIISLTPYEVASLLSFSVWDGPPDATLLSAAGSNQLSSPSQLRDQVRRMQSDVRSSGKMAGFIADLLKIDDVTIVAKDASLGLTTSERNDLLTSAYRTMGSAYSSPQSSLFAAFQGSSFQANQNIARFLNVPSQSLGGQFTPVSLPSTERHGMLSHPAFLTTMSGQVGSGIVKRGVFTLEQLLCYHLPTPPADISGNPSLPPGFDRDLVSTREELRITHSAQSSCIGCHAVIDPAGFGYENYNGLGQFRVFEKNNILIDASGSLSGIVQREINYRDSVDYFRALEQSPDFRSCVKKMYFKSVTGQTAKDGPGRCEYQNFESRVSQHGDSLGGILESLVQLESFTRRRGGAQ